MLAYPKYETYQPTGEDWLGEIPENWQLLRTKNIFRLVCEPAPENNSEELLSVYSDIGVKPRRELEERGNKASTTDGYWFVKKGDVVVNKLLAWMGAIGVSDYNGVTSPAYDILRAYKPIDSKFYHYLFRNPICISKLKQHSKGIMEMRLRLYFDEFGNIKIPYPPLEEQKRIVEFLDRKTAEIDQAIAQKQRLIELLQEQKAILINQAVTKGVNPNASMQDSGIDWLGEYPAHWQIKQLKYLCVLQRGFDLPSQNRQEGEFPIYGGGGITGYHSKAMVQPPGVVTGRYGTVGEVYLVNEPFWPLNTSLYVKEFWGNSPEFVRYILSILPMETYSAKAAVPGINRNDVHVIPVAVPPLKEQLEIARKLASLEKYFELQINLELRKISLYQELEAILISNIVGGKIKV